jgi:hypothetical protein
MLAKINIFNETVAVWLTKAFGTMWVCQGCSTLCSSSGDPAASESEMPHDHANRPVMAA